MLGAAIAAREGKLLTLATGEFLPKGPVGAVAHIVAGAVGAMIATILALGGIALVERSRGRQHASPTACRPGSPTSRCRSASG